MFAAVGLGMAGLAAGGMALETGSGERGGGGPAGTGRATGIGLAGGKDVGGGEDVGCGRTDDGGTSGRATDKG
jgi:hypothetical protein